ALKALQDMSSSAQSAPVPQSSRKTKNIPVQTFEVKLDMLDLSKIVKSQKYTLSVDVDGGKLVVMKKVKDSQEDWNTFTHDKIRQLIKSQRVPSKLGIVFEKEKDKTQRKDFLFASIRKREAFCQLLQLMKNKHSNQDEPDMISVFIGTWNMGSVPPQKSLGSWIGCKGLGKTQDEMTVTIPHDIYVFGTQENSVTDRDWADFLRAMLKDLTEGDYRPVHRDWADFLRAMLKDFTEGDYRPVRIRGEEPMYELLPPRATTGCDWADFLRAMLKDFTEGDYRPVAMQSLWNIKIVVLVRAEHENRITHISTSSVKTGIANTL
ncbi:phosphatidylinositol 3,4,5-trisphosphate 5-phosphatase 2-like, partial [Mantella aurantiaca]